MITPTYQRAVFFAILGILVLPLRLIPQDQNANRLIPRTGEIRAMHAQEAAARTDALRAQRLMKSLPGAPEQQNYDARYYRLELRLDPSQPLLSGSVRIRGTALVDNFNLVVLDLLENMTIDSLSGDAVEGTHSGDLLSVPLTQPIDSGTAFTIDVAYHGVPTAGLYFSQHGDSANVRPMIWSLSEPYSARGWWPCKDTPGDKADSVDIILWVPNSIMAISNGTSRDFGTYLDLTAFARYEWHENYPISTYLVSVAATDYAIESDQFHYAPGDSLPVDYYAYPENIDQARAGLSQCLDMLAVFHRIFGPYPFLDEKYGIAQFPRGGGMEHQTIASQSHFGEMLSVHELAHQWWGDKITNATWGDIWLNEGFASYAEALYFEDQFGSEYYHAYMEEMNFPFENAIFVADTSEVRNIFTSTVYEKGAWLLHMLRHVVGDSAFFEILLSYSNDPRFAYGNATSAGFQDVCETVADTTLDWFFNAWLHQTGRPVYRLEWGATEVEGGPAAEVNIVQTQAPQNGLFPMPLDIAISTLAGDTLITVINDQEFQTFTIPLAAAPQALILDPDNWVLKDMASSGVIDPGNGTPVPFALRQNYPNPFNTTTRIEYTLSAKAVVMIVLYDLLGREIALLLDEAIEGGYRWIDWDGTDRDGRALPSGIYFYRLTATPLPGSGLAAYRQTMKLVLLR